MKKLYILTLLLTAYLGASAQMSILFVDDSDDTFSNAESLNTVINGVGYTTTYFNAESEGTTPTDSEMNEYDLVIWHTSSDGTDLQFWNGLDEDNTAIQAYLDEGGMLWVVGLDFLYDRYGSAPIAFDEGDFVYDYLGVESYNVQSYGDDGSLGVPQVDPDPNSPIEGLNTLTWLFSTLWWADGVTPISEASKVYIMGDSEYVFADEVTAVLHETEDFKCLSYFFDLAVVADQNMMGQSVLPVLQYFNSLVTGTEEKEQNDVSIYPNPSSDVLRVSGNITLENASYKVIGINGELVQTGSINSNRELNIRDLPAGIYQLILLNKDTSTAHKFVKL